MTKRWRWLIAALLVAAAAATWTTQRAQACLFGSCDAIIIANQVTQIAHMVTQIGKMVDQLQSLDGVLSTTTELVTSNDIGMGNIGRLREVTDAEWLIGRHGIGPVDEHQPGRRRRVPPADSWRDGRGGLARRAGGAGPGRSGGGDRTAGRPSGDRDLCGRA